MSNATLYRTKCVDGKIVRERIGGAREVEAYEPDPFEIKEVPRIPNPISKSGLTKMQAADPERWRNAVKPVRIKAPRGVPKPPKTPKPPRDPNAPRKRGSPEKRICEFCDVRTMRNVRDCCEEGKQADLAAGRKLSFYTIKRDQKKLKQA